MHERERLTRIPCTEKERSGETLTFARRLESMWCFHFSVFFHAVLCSFFWVWCVFWGHGFLFFLLFIYSIMELIVVFWFLIFAVTLFNFIDLPLHRNNYACFIDIFSFPILIGAGFNWLIKIICIHLWFCVFLFLKLIFVTL